MKFGPHINLAHVVERAGQGLESFPQGAEELPFGCEAQCGYFSHRAIGLTPLQSRTLLLDDKQESLPLFGRSFR